MIWIDDEPIQGDPNNSGRTATSDMFTDTVQEQADFPYQNNQSPYAGGVVPYAVAIDQTVGGIGTPGKLLGWSDGVKSVAQRWKRLTGLVIMPPDTARLRASMPYGQIGLLNHSQNLLYGTQLQQEGNLLPSAADIASSYTGGRAR